MTKTTRIVCLCILGAGIFFTYQQHRIAISKVDLGILSIMGKLGIMGNLSKKQNTHSTQNTHNTQLNLTTNNYLYTLNVILSIAKNLAVSDFGDACTDLEIFRYAQDDTYNN